MKKIISIFSMIVFVSVYLVILKNSLKVDAWILVAMLLIVAGYAILQKKNVGKNMFRGCFCVMCTIQLFFGYFLMIEYSTWDVYVVTKSAMSLANGEWFNSSYFAMYPNNMAIMLLFLLVFKVTNFLFGSTSIYFLVVLNIIAIDSAILIAVNIMKRLCDYKVAYRVGIVMTVFAPFYLYVPICYTDTFSLPLVMGLINWTICLSQKWNKLSQMKKGIQCISLGGLIFVSYKVKGSIIVILVALSIYWLYKFRIKTFVKAMGCIVIGLFIYAAIWNISVYTIKLVEQEEYDKYQFPVTHWIMMGMNGQGNYNQDDVDFTKGFSDYQQKRSATLDVLNERIQDLGVAGVIQQFYKKATEYTWNYGTCYAERYLGDMGDKPYIRNILHEYILTKGRYHSVFYCVTQGIWLVILGSASINYIYGIKDKNLEMFFSRMIVVGCMFFFMIWETHPRYILNFTMVLIMIAVIQMEQIMNTVLSINNKNKFITTCIRNNNDE